MCPVLYLRTRKPTEKKKVGMKIRHCHIAVRYRNKIHDFHAWGVAALI